ALNRADALFDVGLHDEDLPWLHVDGNLPGNLACHQMCAAQALGEFPHAERAWHTVHTALGSTPTRSYTLYQARLAQGLTAQRRIDEAVSVAARAVVGASEISSRRIDVQIHRARAGLAPYSANPQVAEFLDWSAQVLAPGPLQN